MSSGKNPASGQDQGLANVCQAVPEAAGDTGANWWRQLVEQSRDGIVVIDRRGAVFWTNDEFARMLRCSRQEVYDLDVWAWDAEIPPEAIDQMLDSVDNTGHHFETRHRRQDGSFYDVEICTNAVAFEGTKLILCICRDITERKRTEREMQQLLAETRSLARQLELQKDRLVQAEKLASLGRIAAGIAHEINNPLAFVLSNFASLTEYLSGLSTVVRAVMNLVAIPESAPPTQLRSAIDELRTKLEETDAEFAAQDACLLLDENSEGIERIRSIVDNLKGYVHQDARQPTRTTINDMIEGALAASRGRIKDHCRIVRELADDLPEVTWFPHQIQQMLLNLMVNSCAAIPERGTITIAAACAGASHVQLEVRDDGSGIAPEIRDRLFDPFFTTKDAGKGTGLGLHVVHSIVERHGGRIEVESRPGAGATFRILLPVELPDPSART